MTVPHLPARDGSMQQLDEASHIMVFTTLGTSEDAVAFVRGLIERRVVACGTVIGPVTSVYRWQGEIEEATETQVILKTRRERWQDLEHAVRDSHPYDVPELLAMPVGSGLPAYLDWVTDQTARADEAPA